MKAPAWFRAARRSQYGGPFCLISYLAVSGSTSGQGLIPKAALGAAVLGVYFAAWWLADKVARRRGVAAQ